MSGNMFRKSFIALKNSMEVDMLVNFFLLIAGKLHLDFHQKKKYQ